MTPCLRIVVVTTSPNHSQCPKRLRIFLNQAVLNAASAAVHWIKRASPWKQSCYLPKFWKTFWKKKTWPNVPKKMETMFCSFVSNFASESSGFFASKSPPKSVGLPSDWNHRNERFPRHFVVRDFLFDGFFGGRVKLQVFWRVFVEFISVSFSCFISSMERHFLGTEIQKSYYELTVSSSPFSHHPIPYRSTFSWFNSFVVITPSPSASIIFIISCVQGAKMLGGIQHKSFCITFFREGKQKMNKIRWAFVVLLRRSLKSSKICSAVYDFCFLQQLFFANFALKSFIPKIPKWLHFAKNTTFERVLKKHWIKGDWNVV